jgi:hypothetical protein
MREQTALICKAMATKLAKEFSEPNPFSQGTPAKKRLKRKRTAGRVHMRP